VRTIADLKIGEYAQVADLTDEKLESKLLEMGCVPGCKIKMSCKAPFNGPLCICVCGYNLSLRKEEAASITVN